MSSSPYKGTTDTDLATQHIAHNRLLRNDSHINCSGRELHSTWRERNNNKPLTVTRTNGERNEFI